MSAISMLSPLGGAVTVLLVLVVGAYVTAVMRRFSAGAPGREPLPALAVRAMLEPLQVGAQLMRQQPTVTERPDALLRDISAPAYAAVAGVALTVVPLDAALAIADVRTGIVLFGAAEALAIVAIFLHGWAPNAHLSLLGGFRFVALGLSYELLSMFVLIAAALPAESLRVSAIVESQADLWNVVRQPLGLPLWLIVIWGVTFSGPLDVADGPDLAGGTSAESSGRQMLAWQIARGGMLTVFCGMGAAVLLGGWHGPLLPGWAWMTVKTAGLMWLAVWLGQQLPRVQVERAVKALWTLALPLSFVHLGVAGVEALP